MSDDFGVGLRDEDDAGCFKLGLEGMRVFNDAVMDEGDAMFRI